LKVNRMARQSKPQLPKQPAQSTPQKMKSGIERLKKCLEDLNRFEPRSVTDQHKAPKLDALVASIDEALVRTFGADTLDYGRYEFAKVFDRGPSNYMHPTQPAEFQASISRSKDRSVALLRQAIKSLEDQLEERSSNPPVNQASPETTRLPSRKIFIVHGHEGEPREAVSGFLRKIDFMPVILHEQSNQGRTIVEKFEAHAEVDFAVVLLTPDDVGGPIGGAQQPRARQNVILELGYFIGKLGRQNVCAIKLGDLEIPSDIIGVVWTPFDAHGA
jgi:hypothetical protein